MPEATQDKDLDKEEGKKGFLFPFIIIFFVLAFISGYFLRQSFEPNFLTRSIISPTPKETPTTLLFEENDPNNPFFQKEYFNDTYVVIEEAAPFRSLLLTIDRVEKTNNFSQEVNVFYFDGTTWKEDAIVTTIPTNDVRINNLLKNLTEPFVNKGSMSALLKIDQQEISFSSEELKKEITISSNGEGGQFIYQGSGLLFVDSTSSKANVFHLREFSFNAAKVEYVIDPENATKNHLVFWDKEGSFYFSERLQNRALTNSNEEFTHGIKIDNRDLISRTDSFSATGVTKKGKETMNISFKGDINDLLELPLINPLRSSENTKSITSSGRGKIIKREGRTVEGVGLITNN